MSHMQRRKSRELTPRQKRFVAEYVTDFNATRAARAAGYSATCARAQGSRMLQDVNISAAIGEIMAESLKKAALTRERVDQELARIAFADIRKLHRPDGTMLPVDEWPNDIVAAVAWIETVERKAKGGRAIVKKLKLWDKVAALVLACRRLGLLSDHVRLSGHATLEQLVLQSLQPGDKATGLERK